MVRSTLVLLIAVMLLAPGAHAAEKITPAERLHEAAIAAHAANKKRQAIELWRDALKLEPNWKYAYNLANTLYETDDGLGVWEALAQAEALKPPDKYVGNVIELRSKVRALLYKDHAWLVLTVTTPGATVTRNGQPWDAPWDAWVTEAESEIVVEAPGMQGKAEKVKHPIGKRTERLVVLEPKMEVKAIVGTLRLDGTPVGARVFVRGVDRGTLPLAPVEVEIGDAEVVVTHPGFVDDKRVVRIEEEREAWYRFELVAKPDTSRPAGNGLATPGWATLIGGVLVAGGGVGMYFWADAAASDIETLNGSREQLLTLGDYARYDARYDELKDAADTRLLVSQLMLGVGGAAIVTGVVLLLLDDTPSGEGTVHVVPVSGGGMVVGGASF